MPIEIDRWFSSPAVQAMKDFQRWWFMSLLMRAWQLDPPCHLPNDQNRLWMLAGAPSLNVWQKQSAIVIGQFDASGDGQWLINQRQLEIYNEKLGNYEISAKKGRLGAQKRWLNHSSGIAEPSISYSNESVSSSEVGVAVAFEVETFDFESAFRALWKIYPRREDSPLIHQWFFQAIEKCCTLHGFRRSEAANYILSRTQIYVEKCKFIKNFRDYLYDATFEQDESMWEASDDKPQGKLQQLRAIRAANGSDGS